MEMVPSAQGCIFLLTPRLVPSRAPKGQDRAVRDSVKRRRRRRVQLGGSFTSPGSSTSPSSPVFAFTSSLDSLSLSLFVVFFDFLVRKSDGRHRLSQKLRNIRDSWRGSAIELETAIERIEVI